MKGKVIACFAAFLFITLALLDFARPGVASGDSESIVTYNEKGKFKIISNKWVKRINIENDDDIQAPLIREFNDGMVYFEMWTTRKAVHVDRHDNDVVVYSVDNNQIKSINKKEWSETFEGKSRIVYNTQLTIAGHKYVKKEYNINPENECSPVLLSVSDGNSERFIFVKDTKLKKVNYSLSKADPCELIYSYVNTPNIILYNYHEKLIVCSEADVSAVIVIFDGVLNAINSCGSGVIVADGDSVHELISNNIGMTIDEMYSHLYKETKCQ